MSTAEDNILMSLKDAVTRILPKGSKAILFGSRARGNVSVESDWDILLLRDKDQITNSDFDSYAYPLVEIGWSLGQYFST